MLEEIRRRMNCSGSETPLVIYTSISFVAECLPGCLSELQSMIWTSPAYLFIASQDFCTKFGERAIHNLVSSLM